MLFATDINCANVICSSAAINSISSRVTWTQTSANAYATQKLNEILIAGKMEVTATTHPVDV